MTRLLAILFLTTPAFAGDKLEIPEQPKPVTSAADADALAAALAKQSQTANGGDANGGAGGSGVGKVSVTGDTSEFDAKALALGAIRAAAAPAVSDTCLIHTRGWDATVGGQTGGTKYDQSCMDRKQCLAIADRLALWGQVDAALEQLRTCDKASFAAPLPLTPVPTQSASTAPPVSVERDAQCASKEYVGTVVDRAVKACVSK